jgi:hypothetical protein
MIREKNAGASTVVQKQSFSGKKNIMKKTLVGLVAVMLLFPGGNENKAVRNREAYAAVPKKTERVLRHVVLFKFKESAAPEDITRIENAFRALPGKIPQIVDFEWGINNSPENRSQGFTHCFFVTFRNEADRDAYLPHPAHKEFGKVLGPHLDKVLVIDYWTKR